MFGIVAALLVCAVLRIRPFLTEGATVSFRRVLHLATLAAATEQFGYQEPLGKVGRQTRRGGLRPVEDMPLSPALRQHAC